MFIVPMVALIIGFGLGWLRASRRGGAMADKLQYGVAHGIIFALGTFLFFL